MSRFPILHLLLAWGCLLFRTTGAAPSPVLLELPRCFGDNMIVPPGSKDDWFLWGWRPDDGADLQVRFPEFTAKPVTGETSYWSRTNHPGKKLWHLEWKDVPPALLETKGRPFSLILETRGRKRGSEVRFTNVVVGSLVAVGVRPNTFAPPHPPPLPPSLRLFRATTLNWEPLSPREASVALGTGWMPGPNYTPDAAEAASSTRYLLAEIARQAGRPVGVILYPHPTGVDFATTGRRRLLSEATVETGHPLLGPACRAAQAAAGLDYRSSLADYRTRMIPLKREGETAPPPWHPAEFTPYRLHHPAWQRLRLDAAAW